MLLVNPCLGRACPVQAEVEIHPLPSPSCPPSGSGTVSVSGKLRKCPQNPQRTHCRAAKPSPAPRKARHRLHWWCLGAGLRPPIPGTVLPAGLLGVVFWFRTHCDAAVSPQVPACPPQLWPPRERHKRGLSWLKRGLCFVSHSFCPLVKHRADTSKKKKKSSGWGAAARWQRPSSCAPTAEHHRHPRREEKRPQKARNPRETCPRSESIAASLPPARHRHKKPPPPLPAGSYSEPGALSDTFPHLEGDDTHGYI